MTVPEIVDLGAAGVEVVDVPAASPGVANLGLDAPEPPWWLALRQIEAGEIDPAFVAGIVDDRLAQVLSSGGALHHGQGPPPALIPGVRVGDYYINSLTGDIYKLGG